MDHNQDYNQKLLLEMLTTFALKKYNANSGLHHLVKKRQWQFETITLRPHLYLTDDHSLTILQA